MGDELRGGGRCAYDVHAMAEDHDDTGPRIVADRYELLRPVGRGGTGTVWLARDRVLHRQVALKEIHGLPGEDGTQGRAARQEARSAAALNHPNVIAVHDVIDHGGMPWLVMEYVDGPPSPGLSASGDR